MKERRPQKTLWGYDKESELINGKAKQQARDNKSPKKTKTGTDMNIRKNK